MFFGFMEQNLSKFLDLSQHSNINVLVIYYQKLLYTHQTMA